MPSFVEELVLLMLDDDGSFIAVQDTAADYGIAGATLMDLAFADRIDTDADRLTVIDPSPTGDAIPDHILSLIAGSGEARPASAWIARLAREEAQPIRKMALDSLVERGILERSGERFLWVFERTRHPVVDDRAERAAKQRIADAIFSDDIPDPRDAALICLVDACAILPAIFSVREIEKARPRIERLRKLDPIGREMSEAIEEIRRSIMIAMSYMPH